MEQYLFDRVLTKPKIYFLGDKEGHAVSPFHDIPLFANDEVSQKLL